MSQAVVIGGGPAGLMAAEVLAEAGIAVTLADRMPSLGRRLLMAGRGGLNLTHAEPLERFLTRYTPPEPRLLAAIRGRNTATGMVESIRVAVRAFENGTDPTDDMTIMALRYLG